MGPQTVSLSNPNKKFIPQKYNNWFDEQKGKNSRYGQAWMDHVLPVVIQDGFINRLIPDFERGRITFDMYPEAFSSSNFIVNVIPGLDTKAQECKAYYDALMKVDPKKIFGLQVIAEKNYIREKIIDNYFGVQEYTILSQRLSAYGDSHNRSYIDQMMIDCCRIKKARDIEKSKLELEEFSAGVISDDYYERVKRFRRDAKRIIASIARPKKFVVREFVDGLKKDTTILGYILEECENATRYVSLVQEGLMESENVFDKLLFNKLQEKYLGTQRVYATFMDVKGIIDNAVFVYQNTGVFVFPEIIMTNLINLQKTMFDSYKETF